MSRVIDRWLVKHNIVAAVVLAAVLVAAFAASGWLRLFALLVLFAPIYWKTHFEEDLRRW